ncbi:MAG TPA: replication protein [Fimbriimonadaceae bacterium]|nr:replication protein [Fimbriimonadaceae bacterium]
MPSEEKMTRSGSTPLPNLLVDRLLPRLRDTELRLLLVILRQTWGWHKERDWLSHAQLKDKTGRASAALSRAIAVLVQSNLIVVRNRSGEALESSWARRRERGGLHFSLHPTLTARFLEERRAEIQNRTSQMRKDNKKEDKRKTVVVDDQNDQPVYLFGGDVSQNEREDDRNGDNRAEFHLVHGHNEKQTRSAEEMALDRQSAHSKPIKDPLIEAKWRQVGQELKNGKYGRWKRGR